MALTKKRQVFLQEYLKCWNASEAARRAGYAYPGREGYRLLKNAEIRQEIMARLKEKAMDADEVLARLADQARASMADFISLGEDGCAKLDLARAQERGLLHLIKTYSETKYGVRIDLHDAQAALVHLGRAHGLFKDRVDVGVRLEDVLAALPDDLGEAVRRLLVERLSQEGD